jgi:hypothetical protein
VETVTKVYTIYEFDELNDEAKEEARQWFREAGGNFYDGWWDWGGIEEDLEKLGLGCDTKEMCFDLDRGSYLYFHGKGIWISDLRKFLKCAGVDLRSKDARDLLESGDISIQTSHYGGGYAKNYIEPEYDIDNIDLTDYLNDVFQDIIRDLRKEMEYLESDEAVDETIRANCYTFLENGKREN